MTRLVAMVLTMAALIATVPSAHAAFPGRNGKIVFDRTGSDGGSSELFIVNPDGSVGVPRHRNAPAVDSAPPSYDSFERG